MLGIIFHTARTKMGTTEKGSGLSWIALLALFQILNDVPIDFPDILLREYFSRKGHHNCSRSIACLWIADVGKEGFIICQLRDAYQGQVGLVFVTPARVANVAVFVELLRTNLMP